MMIYRVFLFDDTFLTTSCGRYIDDIDLRFQPILEKGIFFVVDMPYMVIYLLLFVLNGNLKMDKFYEKCTPV